MKGILTIFSMTLLIQVTSGQVANPAPYSNTRVSYVRTWDALMPMQISDSLVNRPIWDVKQTTQYVDGLGRPLQTVVKQGSPSQKDMIDGVITYDQFGREQYKYLPFASNVVRAGDITNDGDFKFTPYRQDSVFSKGQYAGETFFYNQANYEASPQNRPSISYAAGGSWVGSSRGISMQYLNNASTDSVQKWNIKFLAGSIPVTAGAYPAGKLEKTIITDENNHQIIEYKDLSGHTVLKKMQLAATPGTAHVGWLNTYYVYDSLENLRFVISPRAVELINTTTNNWVISQGIADELCFRYEYDYRNRMSIKKIPGAGETWMVYDSRDRLILTEDANMRTTHQWLFLKYDALNRPVMLGLYTDNTNISQSMMQSYLTAQGFGLYETYNSGSFPGYSLSGSFPSVTSSAVLTVTYYDDYAWIAATGTALTGTLDASGSSKFLTESNTTFPYPRAVTQNNQTYGLVTGNISKVIGSVSQYIYSVNFYDDHNRIIQTQSINYTGGKDISTTQYDFSGKPIRMLLQHQKNGINAQSHTILTKMDYDQSSRVKLVWKNIDNAAADQLIDSLQYNELGQLRAKYIGNNIDSLVYDYNIRGWMAGINKSFVAGTSGHYFGMELGYDKSASVAPGNTYLAQQFNGNIEGTVWKSKGDGINRKYDFLYDDVNRLTKAAFLQNTTGSAWDNSYLDFTTNNLQYDANGNITTMNQRGFKINGSGLIDSLKYTYQTNSNKLSKVDDYSNDPLSKLGDFHYSGTKQATDYSYDGNGNLLTDNNKAINGIVYNYLNLPNQVNITGKGTIAYTYDASGNKLQKITTDNSVTPAKTTTTTYIGGIIYQNDTLQFVSHEEGRARWAFHRYLNGSTAYKWEYDYFIKDHLGNTRMVLTQEKDTAQYIATMEAAYRATENQLFYNIPQSSYARSAVSGYPSDPTTNPNDSLIRVNGNGPKTGPSILLKVMSGDKVDIATKSFYKSGGTVQGPNSILTDVLNSLAGGIVTATSASHGVVSDLTNTSTSPIYAALNSFLPTNDPNTTGKPKAYLNWILLDDQFKGVNTYPQSGAMVVGSADVLNTLAYTGIPINKNGYVYIWVSNETPGWDVFFDNLSVKQYSGAIIEETHYYPFGLTMAGISDKAAGGLENRYKYNGIELDTSLGLNEFEANLRDLDPQTGRWWQIDPETEGQEVWSPYTSNNDNPILYSDPRGNKGEACCGGIVQLGEDLWDIYSAVKGAKNVSDAAKNNSITWKSVFNAVYKTVEYDQGGFIKVDPKDLPINKDSEAKESTSPPGSMTLTLPPDTKVNGVIYQVPGTHTKTGKPYVGRTKHSDPAKRRSDGGRDRRKAKVVDTYDPNNTQEGREKEQQKIDQHGLDNLDNKRNEIKPPKKNLPNPPNSNKPNQS